MFKLRYIEAVLFCEFVRAIYVYNPGNPGEYSNLNSDRVTTDRNLEYGDKYKYPYVYPFGDIDKDYGIVNVSLVDEQNRIEDPRKKKKRWNRIGFYNVQTGDEFFLNDFEVRPKFKTKQSNRHILGYEYDSISHVPVQEITTTKKPNTSDNPRVGINIQQRPQQQTNNRRKNNKTKQTNNRRKPAVQNTKKQQNQNSNKRPTNNRNKNTNNRTNKRRPQRNNNGCRNPNIPLNNANKRRPSPSITTNKKNTVRPQNHRKPIRIKNNNRNGIRRKNSIQSRDSNNISDVIKKYISKLKSKDFDNSVERSARSLKGRQRSLLTMALNQIRNHSMNFANQFLSFFTVVQYPNYQCIADSDFNYYEGVCYQENQCLKLGGTPLGNCSSYDACCVFKSNCGESTTQNCTYLESPNYPKYFPDNEPSYDDDDEEEGETEAPFFDDYEIDNPLGGGEPSSTMIPTISSGDSSIGDEFFVETDSLADIPSMIGEDMTEASFIEDFDLTEDIDRYKEYQIERESRFQKENLAENFACTFKVFKSSEKVQEMKIEFIDLEVIEFNFKIIYVDVSTLTGPLQISILSNDVYTKRYKLRNNLNYAICIRREIGYCSTTFTNVDEENIEYPFEIINQDNEEKFSISDTNTATDCPDDYIVINNMRICGRTFKPITGRYKQIRNRLITLFLRLQKKDQDRS
ncbi:intraflagellar transport protein 122 family protein-related [Holotrichia oblita]|uniref:Intraflagellar transport protein 122 family protein-related n=1 Tax=Holotrichia oblita TaxID=644536 RepID=A0ACB9SIR8_HOLOL|nr:intraflagellar transport protein 122 family protein-related [Holotrichia oblita]